MCNLSRCVAKPHTPIERRRPQPVQFVRSAIGWDPPETHMVPLSRVVTNWLFECEIFFAPEKKQVTHRSILIRTMEDSAGRDSKTASQRYRIRRVPPSG
jgi:hypothetical protein